MLASVQTKVEATPSTEPALRKNVYVDAQFAVFGTLVTAVCSICCWAITGKSIPLGVAVACVLLTVARAEIARRCSMGAGSFWTQAFVASGIAYLALNGVLIVWAFSATDDPFALCMSIALSLANAFTIPLRYFAVGKSARVLLCLAMAPLCIAFAIRGGYFLIGSCAFLSLTWFIDNSTSRLRNIFQSEITHRRASQQMAEQFEVAIDNMSHGLCMIDSDMRISVVNNQLHAYLGVPLDRKLEGTQFPALIRLSRQRGLIDAGAAARLLANLHKCGDANVVVREEAPGTGGRVFALTLRWREGGGWVLVAQDVSEEKRALAALDIAARIDPVTGLPNRRSFETRLTERLLAARGTEALIEVLFLDLDGFKQINDTLGHKLGDRVLSEAGRRLRDSVGAEGYVARWGGDEFVIMREGRSTRAVIDFAEEIIRELSRPAYLDGAETTIGATAGAAVCVGGSIGMDALLSQADVALYSAKREARGSCRLYVAALSEKARERRLLELDLQAALASRAFSLVYQPIVNLETGELVSFEALARWRHPVRGNVSPAEFVPVLEELNLMHAFGAWTLQQACEDAVRWPNSVRVGVNVSSRQFDTLAETVQRALSNSGLAPNRLELEITETAALSAGDLAREALETVHAIGVRVALDDFGTGYSSLSHLMHFPLDKVKIDRSFTQQLGRNRKADLLVSSIARLSSQLGMRVTFEGVETADQLERARAVGVAAEGQGWLFGKPMPRADLPKLFEQEVAAQVA